MRYLSNIIGIFILTSKFYTVCTSNDQTSKPDIRIPNPINSITTGPSSKLNNSAFCKPWDEYHNRYFPYDLPEEHIPWIWDAVYDPVQQIVELTTMNRAPCKFDKKRWQQLVQHFPNHRHQLGYGLDSNILVPVDKSITPIQEFYLLGYRVMCEYYDDRDVLSYSIASLRIKGVVPFVSVGTLQVRCPVPPANISWHGVRFRLPDSRTDFLHDIFSNVTAIVPVCKIPSYHPNKKIYNLSVCAATGRSHRDHLVEWIEYHRLVGVDHFYIYDTSYDDIHRLSSTLSDYINEGVATVVPWHFMNCVRYMANGRANLQRINNNKVFFESPKAIAQYAALASCYSRFKHTSKYITHIDEDEFLAFSAWDIQHTLKLSYQPTNLVEVSDAIFQANPDHVAIRLEPIMFYPCNITSNVENIPYNAIQYPPQVRPDTSYISTVLPRVGVWDVSTIFRRKHESKLIMRTDAVGMYFVHFLSMLEHRKNIETPRWDGKFQRVDDADITLPITHLSLLHYKYPAALAKNIVEGVIPFTARSFIVECNFMKEIGYMGRIFHAQIGYNISVRWKENYRKRMLIA